MARRCANLRDALAVDRVELVARLHAPSIDRPSWPPCEVRKLSNDDGELISPTVRKHRQNSHNMFCWRRGTATISGMSTDKSMYEQVERWRTCGDQAAAEAIFRSYSQRLCRMAERMLSERLRRRESPEDLVQSVFRTFFRRAGDGHFKVDHSNALWRLLVTICVIKIRRKAEYHSANKRDVSIEIDGIELPLEVVTRIPSPAESAMLAIELETLVGGLAERDAQMLELCVQGFSTAEIGEQVGCARQTVRRVLDRIGHQLKKRMEN